MSGALTHSPAAIIQQLLVDLGVGTLASAGGSWPIGAGQIADSPDNAIAVYNTSNIKHGRDQISGEVQEHYGFQMLVRSVKENEGYAKANALAVLLDSSVQNTTVVVGSSNYTVYAVSDRSGVISLGKNDPVASRNLFTINATAPIRQWI